VITFDLSDAGGLTSSCGTASIAIRMIWPHKPHHYVEVRVPSDLHCSPNIIWMIKSRRMRRAGHLACMEMDVACRILMGRLEGKRPHGRPRRGCEDNIKMDHQEVVWRLWTGLIWLRIGTCGADFCECDYEPLGSI
jgi:hypothetical protein